MMGDISIGCLYDGKIYPLVVYIMVRFVARYIS